MAGKFIKALGEVFLSQIQKTRHIALVLIEFSFCIEIVESEQHKFLVKAKSLVRKDTILESLGQM